MNTEVSDNMLFQFFGIVTVFNRITRETDVIKMATSALLDDVRLDSHTYLRRYKL
jgi:hypothetical protein